MTDTYTGRRLSNKDAALVMATLTQIEASSGRLTTTETAKELVRLSRPKGSPTHHLFTWDDREAAEEYRLDQARQAIRAVYVVFKELPAQKPVRAVVNIVHDGKRGPMPMRRVLQSADLTQQLLEKALEDLRIWTTRYEALRGLAELRQVFDTVDQTIKHAAKKRATKTTQRSARV